MNRDNWLLGVAVTCAFGVGGCSTESNPPVEILYADIGRMMQSSSGMSSTISTYGLKLSAGDEYAWRMYIRTNKPIVEVTQEVTMSDAAEWELPDDPAAKVKYRISKDRRTATVTDQEDTADGILFGIWGITESDPPGPVTVKITIDGKVERVFSLEVKGTPKG